MTAELLRCKVCGEQYPPGGRHCESAPARSVGRQALKLLQLLGVLALCAGAVTCSAGPSSATGPLWIGGALAYAAGRAGLWWFYG